MTDKPKAKNVFLGMLTGHTTETADPVLPKAPDASPRDGHETSISFRTHYDVRHKLRQDAMDAQMPLEAYLRSLCVAGMPRDAAPSGLPNKAESQVRVTFRCTVSLRRKVRQDALDQDMTVEQYITRLVLHGLPAA